MRIIVGLGLTKLEFPSKKNLDLATLQILYAAIKHRLTDTLSTILLKILKLKK